MRTPSTTRPVAPGRSWRCKASAWCRIRLPGSGRRRLSHAVQPAAFWRNDIWTGANEPLGSSTRLTSALAAADGRGQSLSEGSIVLRPGYLDRLAQEALLAAVRDVMRQAPLYTPRMPRSGKPFSVRMTNCGRLGWVSNQNGYRYQAEHPETGHPWPPIPDMVRKAWDELSDYPGPPQACLVN